MIFHSKRDRGRTVGLVIFEFFLLLFTLIGFFMSDMNLGLIKWVILMICLFIEAGFAWMFIDIQYNLQEDHLFVKAGPIRSRIPYEKIRQTKETDETATGYKMLASADAIQIFHDRKSVKISPANRNQFLKELWNRNPEIKIDPTCWKK